VRRIGGRQAARLAAFEGADYALRPVAVGTPAGAVAARAFMARPGVRPSGREWEFEPWRRRFAALYLRRAGARLRG
jgi:hypothetical protein